MRQRHADEEQERTVKGKKWRQRCCLCHDSLLSHGGEDVCSHAPAVRLKNPGLLHSLQQSNSTHGCLVGKKLVIPPIPSSGCFSSFHIPFSHTTSICILFASTSPRVSWPPCNKETSSAFLFFLKDTGEHRQHDQQPRRCLCQAEMSGSRKSNGVLSS